MASVRGEAEGGVATSPARPPRPLPAGGAQAAGPLRPHHGRSGGQAVAGSGAGLGAPALAEGSAGATQAQGVLHVHRAAGLGQGERVPVGRAGQEGAVPRPSCTRVLGLPGPAAIRAGARLPVGRVHMLLGRCGRAPGRSEQVQRINQVLKATGSMLFVDTKI